MSRLWKNPWIKTIVFLAAGILVYFLLNRLIGILEIERLRDIIGIDIYRIITRIAYICFGLAFFAAANRFIRGKGFKDLFLLADEYKPSHIFKYTIIGTLFPVFALGLIFLVLFLLGFIKVYSLSDSMTILGLISISLNVLITALFEELAFRSFLYRIIEKRYGCLLAAIISSVLFSLIHISSKVGIVALINLFLLSILFVILNIQAKSVWPSILAHFAWNFMHSVVLSLRMYGGIYVPHLMEIDVEGPEILSGSNMGLESSILTIILLIIFIFYSYKKLKGITENVKS